MYSDVFMIFELLQAALRLWPGLHRGSLLVCGRTRPHRSSRWSPDTADTATQNTKRQTTVTYVTLMNSCSVTFIFKQTKTFDTVQWCWHGNTFIVFFISVDMATCQRMSTHVNACQRTIRLWRAMTRYGPLAERIRICKCLAKTRIVSSRQLGSVWAVPCFCRPAGNAFGWLVLPNAKPLHGRGCPEHTIQFEMQVWRIWMGSKISSQSMSEYLIRFPSF